MNMIVPPECRLKADQVVLFIVDVEYGVYGIKCGQDSLYYAWVLTVIKLHIRILLLDDSLIKCKLDYFTSLRALLIALHL